MANSKTIPVIDLFAGPGGLGEGFSAYSVAGSQRFDIQLSIEKETNAHKTLELRAFYRQFPKGDAPEMYYEHLRGEVRRDELMNSYPRESKRAKQRAIQLELRRENRNEVREKIAQKISRSDAWVLLGGPPCQAYSLIGRSRRAGTDNDNDPRNTLYHEYLQVIADHWPAIFIMENVKGLLSASVGNKQIFKKILEDLTDPADAVRIYTSVSQKQRSHQYQLMSLSRRSLFDAEKPTDFILQSQKYGVPQARHRIFIVGIRDDLNYNSILQLISVPPVPIVKVLGSLPRLRSGISRGKDSKALWKSVLRGVEKTKWIREIKGDIADQILYSIDKANQRAGNRGGEFVRSSSTINYLKSWYYDPRIKGICNHSTRGHMISDLHRYLFASCFAQVRKKSPSLVDFPVELYPLHKNVNRALSGSLFADRFRVQLRDRPSTTITSHISKDGHYYIHYDSKQCRSLTVREAARLQTFPDNYYFCGGRTSQYVQVGNAVPPWLAYQIAGVVSDILG